MTLKTRLMLNKLKSETLRLMYIPMKPLARFEEYIDKMVRDKHNKKVKNMTEEEVINRVAKSTIKYLARNPKGCDDFHIAKSMDDWTERTIRNHMIDLYRGDKYVRSYGYSLKTGDVDTYRRLAEMLYDRLSQEKELCVTWKKYENISYYWKGYEKTLIVEVRKELLQ